MESLSEPLLIFWRAFGDWGFILVIVGVLGEVLAAAGETVLEKFSSDLLDKWRPRLKRYEIIAGWILIIGLAMEYEGHKNETVILDSDNAKLYFKAEQAGKDAADARLETVKIKQQMANLDSSKLPLHSVTAEAKLCFQSQQELVGDLDFPARLEISESEHPGSRLFLKCREAIFVGPRRGQPVYLLTFSSPFWPVTLPSAFGLMRGQSAKTASDLTDTISLQITNFPVMNADMVGGFLTVHFNEIIHKRFPINPGTIKNGVGVLTVQLNTNNPVGIDKSQ